MRFVAILILSLFASMMLAACGCDTATPQPAADPPPEIAGEQASTPKLIAAVTPMPTPEEASQAIDPFSVTIGHALLFDPRTGPINAGYSDEAGVHLLISGMISNKTGRLLHRAAIYATLIATFKEKTELERHSGGLGFSPRITSMDPWRRDEERSFICITRPLDPIYLELVPENLTAAITVQVRDPLQYRFRGEVAKLQVNWDTIFGVASTRTATVTVDGPAFCAPQQRKKEFLRGDVVKVLYQRGLAFKVVGDDGRMGWLGYDRLMLHEQTDTAPAEWASTRFPIRIELAEGIHLQVLRVAEYEAHEGVETENKVYRVELKLFNNSEKPYRMPPIEAFILDAAAGSYQKPIRARSGTKGIYQSTTIKPGSNTEGAILFEFETGSFPFDLEIYNGSNMPIRIPLFPALLAVQDNGSTPQ